MIYGIGIDLASITRVEKACGKEGFLRRVYSEKEIGLYRGDAARLAANFAAKEAFSKALGTGVRGFSMNEVSVCRDGLGKPFYEFSGKAEAIMKEAGLTAFLSLTDEGDSAAAVCVLEKNGI